MKINSLCGLKLFALSLVFSSCMTLNKTDINVMTRDLDKMSIEEKLENCSWILSQYPDSDPIRENRAVIYYKLGLFSYSLDDCGYLIDKGYESDEITAIFGSLNGKNIDIDEEKWLSVYDCYKKGYSNYFKGLFYAQIEEREIALNEFISADKSLHHGFLKMNACELAGDIYAENLLYDNAIIYYRKADKIYSKDLNLHFKMFEVFLKQNDLVSAKEELKVIKELSGDELLYQNAIKKLEY